MHVLGANRGNDRARCAWCGELLGKICEEHHIPIRSPPKEKRALRGPLERSSSSIVLATNYVIGSLRCGDKTEARKCHIVAEEARFR